MLMQSDLLANTAIFVVWSHFGGFYDHLLLLQADQFGLGPRVPLLIISPYALVRLHFAQPGGTHFAGNVYRAQLRPDAAA